MKYALVVKVNSRGVFDEEYSQKIAELSPEQRAERIAEMKADVRQMFVSETDENAVIDVDVDVDVRLEEVAE